MGSRVVEKAPCELPHPEVPSQQREDPYQLVTKMPSKQFLSTFLGLGRSTMRGVVSGNLVRCPPAKALTRAAALRHWVPPSPGHQ